MVKHEKEVNGQGSRLEGDGLLHRVKHTRVEGHVVQNEFERMLLPSLHRAGWRSIDALVLRRLSKSTRRMEFDVLSRESRELTDRLHDALGRTGVPVRGMSMVDDRLFMHHDEHGAELPSPVPVEPCVDGHALRTTSSAIEASRTREISRRFDQAGLDLERIEQELRIKDVWLSHGHWMWDIDRILLAPDGRMHLLEIKHKYPMPWNMTFGMNAGEVDQSRLMSKAGFGVWHVILAKPVWEKRQSSRALFEDERIRHHALWMAADMVGRRLHRRWWRPGVGRHEHRWSIEGALSRVEPGQFQIPGQERRCPRGDLRQSVADDLWR